MGGALTTGQARARLERMLQWQVAPALTSQEVDDLLDLARLPDLAGNPPDALADWSASTAVGTGAVRVPTSRNGYAYRATAGGTTGSAEPAWPRGIGQTVADGGVTWACSAAVAWFPTFDLAAAAAEGWTWKAGKVAAEFDVKAGSVGAQRSQKFEACMKQAERYRRGRVGALGSTTLLAEQ